MSMIHIKDHDSFIERVKHLNVGLIALVCLLAAVGIAALYSAAGGDFSPWAMRQGIRFIFCFVIMIGIALIDIRWWYRLAWPAYGAGLALLLAVEVMGHIGMGAQRWIDLGFMKLQPSELMKIATIMVLARIFHAASAENIQRLSFLILPAIVILIPVGFVLLQPDLGTALMLSAGGVGMIFLAGAPLWIFISAIVAGIISVPILWSFLHDYQKRRIQTFLDPESDPLGAGYHITQSKIAIGSGGVDGKGFLEGTQARLNFLPEKQTDFIFTLWAEEWGLIGGLVLLLILGCIIFYAMWIALRSKHRFGKLLAMGLGVNFSLYVFVNIAMVMGLVPVVGAPLPLVSYGGTVMLSTMIGFGLIMSCHIYRTSKVNRSF